MLPRLSKTQLLFLMYFSIVLLLGFFIFVEKRHSETLSTKLESIQSQLDELQTDFMKVHGIVKPDANRKPNIKLLNSKDIDKFHGDILILVTSHIQHRERRNSIRLTWGDAVKFTDHRRKYNDTTYKTYFVTGYIQNVITEAKFESSIYKDLLITNRTEEY